MQDDLIVRDTRQLQALSNPVRQQMLEHLCREPFTATQLGHLMNMAPARAHYHLKQLVTVGLAELIETRETSGIVEKYYRAVARRFHLTKTVAHDPAEHAAARHTLRVQVHSAVEAFERRVQEEIGPDDGSLPPDVTGAVLDLRLTPARYERFLAQHGVGPGDVLFAGYVDEPTKARYYASCDVFCAPSTGRESFGIVLLEALAAGKPVVASAMTGVAELVDSGRNGFLVSPGDADALASAIDHLRQDPRLRAEMGAAGREKVRREFNQETSARQLAQLFGG